MSLSKFIEPTGAWMQERLASVVPPQLKAFTITVMIYTPPGPGSRSSGGIHAYVNHHHYTAASDTQKEDIWQKFQDTIARVQGAVAGMVTRFEFSTSARPDLVHTYFCKVVYEPNAAQIDQILEANLPQDPT
jgi:hypothetical protein